MANIQMTGPTAGAVHIAGKEFKPSTTAIYSIPEDLRAQALACGLKPLDGGTSSGVPTVLDIPPGQSRIWKNTGDGSVKFYYNDGGTLKSVALT